MVQCVTVTESLHESQLQALHPLLPPPPLLAAFKLLSWGITVKKAHDICHWNTLTCQQVIVELAQTFSPCVNISQLLNFLYTAPPHDVDMGLFHQCRDINVITFGFHAAVVKYKAGSKTHWIRYRTWPWFKIVQPSPHNIKCLVLSNLIIHSLLCPGVSPGWFSFSLNSFSLSVISSSVICSYSWLVCPLTIFPSCSHLKLQVIWTDLNAGLCSTSILVPQVTGFCLRKTYFIRNT